MNYKLKKFTLIELIVVVTIIGILTTLLFSALEVGKARLQKTECLNNLKQLGVGVASFTGDNQGTLPAASIYWIKDGERSSGCQGTAWKFQIGKYVYPNSGVDYVLEAHSGQYVESDKLYDINSGLTHENLFTGPFECPKASLFVSSDGVMHDDMKVSRRGGYGWNQKLLIDDDTLLDPSVNIARVEVPSETISIADTLLLGQSETSAGKLYWPTRNSMANMEYKVHGEGINMLWVDGHASWKTDDELRSTDIDDYFFVYQK